MLGVKELHNLLKKDKTRMLHIQCHTEVSRQHLGVTKNGYYYFTCFSLASSRKFPEYEATKILYHMYSTIKEGWGTHISLFHDMNWMPLISSHVSTMGPRAGGVIWESCGTFRRLSLLKEVGYWEKVLRLYILVTCSFCPSWECLQCDQNRSSPWYIIIKKLNVQRTE